MKKQSKLEINISFLYYQSTYAEKKKQFFKLKN